MITENQLKCGFVRQMAENDEKKTKRLTGIQVLTKDFISSKIRYKALRKRK